MAEAKKAFMTFGVLSGRVGLTDWPPGLIISPPVPTKR